MKALGVVLAVLAVAGVMWWVVGGRSSRGGSVAAQGIETLPSFTAPSLDGRTLRSSDYAGKILIVNFWASWCGPCVEEVPSLVKLSKAMPDRLRILAISSDTVLEDVHVFLKSFPEFQRPGIDLVFDGGQSLILTKLFGVGRLPESFVFDGQGKMVRKVVGTIDWASEDAIGYLSEIARRAESPTGSGE
jgi:thiol-disulfide isomerase/thioredoxin